ncbi:MAG: dihydrolipoamide acetyltransferase family protein [Bacilli bacterium]
MICMPKLGESVTEGTVVRWFVQPGDTVPIDTPLVEIQTDKVTAELPADCAGTVGEILVMEGATVAVGTPLCYFHTDDLSSPVISQENIAVLPSESEAKPAPRLSPSVRKMLAEHAISPLSIPATGANGRITRRDVLRFLSKEGEPQPLPPSMTEVAEARARARYEAEAMREPKDIAHKEGEDVYVKTERTFVYPITSVQERDTVIPITPIRRTIAQNMLRSKHEIPHAWMMMEVDVTALVRMRNEMKETFFAREGFQLTYFPFFVKAVATALKEYPMLNATWVGDQIIQKHEINISVAVGTETALYVPVIRQVDEKSVKGIGKELHKLKNKVEKASLEIEDMIGGTFTVNNTGSFGSVQSMGIINYPQAAILQVETIQKRPVVLHDGQIAVRDMVNLCLSLDHRVLDGMICGMFLRRVKQLLEDERGLSVY